MKGKIDWKEVEDIVYINSTIKMGLHGITHVKTVCEFAIEIAKVECPDRLDEVMIAAYFHDIGRVDDGHDPEHGIIGARIAERLIKQNWPELCTQRVLIAIAQHVDGKISDDPVI